MSSTTRKNNNEMNLESCSLSWKCQACTFLNTNINANNINRCQMCEAHRPQFNTTTIHTSTTNNTNTNITRTMTTTRIPNKKKRSSRHSSSTSTHNANRRSQNAIHLVDLSTTEQERYGNQKEVEEIELSDDDEISSITPPTTTADENRNRNRNTSSWNTGGSRESFFKVASLESSRSKKRSKSSSTSSSRTTSASLASLASVSVSGGGGGTLSSSSSIPKKKKKRIITTNDKIDSSSQNSIHDSRPSSSTFHSIKKTVNTSTKSSNKNRATNSNDDDEERIDDEEELKPKKFKTMVQSTLFGNIATIVPPDSKKGSSSSSSSSSTTTTRNKSGTKSNNHRQKKEVDSTTTTTTTTTQFKPSLYGERSAKSLINSLEFIENRPNKKQSSTTTTSTSTTPSIKPPRMKPPTEKQYQTLHKKSIHTLHNTFHKQSLRNLQPQAVESALRRKCQIIVMATGGGKSLCYQLPAVVLRGVTIVISPLIALMVDQVKGLCSLGVEAACFTSGRQKENRMILHRLLHRREGTSSSSSSSSHSMNKNFLSGKGGGGDEEENTKPIKVFYCTPEAIQTERFQKVLNDLYYQGRLALIAVDEAHCLSTWGNDFRPAYRKISWLRDSFPDVPCMACTATATAKVISDIKDVLNMNNGEEVHKSTFNRPNIQYEVRYKDSMTEEVAIKDLIHFIKKEHKVANLSNKPCSGIVYVHKRDDTTYVASKIREAGIMAGPYHGGMKDNERKDIQEKWTAGSIQVAVATVAFGMGIDLAHVRYVVHWTMSKSIEGFYQESGRCGRDGLPAKSILYYSSDDANKFAFLAKKEMDRKAANDKDKAKNRKSAERSLDSLKEMKSYCTGLKCRRVFLLKHFGEPCKAEKICRGTCDYCKNPQKVQNDMESTRSGTSRIHREVMQKIRRTKAAAGSASTGQWDGPHNEIDENSSEDEGNSMFSSETAGFVPASSLKQPQDILAHYEALECKEGQNNGFVTFKSKTSSLKSSFRNKSKFA